MDGSWVDIDGATYREFLTRRIAELEPEAKAEKERIERYEQAREKWYAVPFWKRWLVAHPRTDDGEDLTENNAYLNWKWWAYTPKQDALNCCTETLKGVGGELVYHITIDEAKGLGLGLGR